LLIVNTGDGKGKTTAALGAAMRALGHGRKVLVLQFIKGPWGSGEHESVRILQPDMDIRRVGAGFVDPKKGPSEEDLRAAREGLKEAEEALLGQDYGLVVLDEIINAIDCGLLTGEEVIELLRRRRGGLDVIVTGRNAPAELVGMADTVTEFKETKHPFTKGIEARKGIEY